jgi:hypothetical protein
MQAKAMASDSEPTLRSPLYRFAGDFMTGCKIGQVVLHLRFFHECSFWLNTL